MNVGTNAGKIVNSFSLLILLRRRLIRCTWRLYYKPYLCNPIVNLFRVVPSRGQTLYSHFLRNSIERSLQKSIIFRSQHYSSHMFQCKVQGYSFLGVALTSTFLIKPLCVTRSADSENEVSSKYVYLSVHYNIQIQPAISKSKFSVLRGEQCVK